MNYETQKKNTGKKADIKNLTKKLYIKKLSEQLNENLALCIF